MLNFNMFYLLYFLLFSDIIIARSQEPKDIAQLADEIGLYPGEISQYGSKKAKIHLSVLDRYRNQKRGKYVVVVG